LQPLTWPRFARCVGPWADVLVSGDSR